MASRTQNRRTALHAYLEEKRPTAITETDWTELLARLAPISESYLRRLLRATQIPLAPLVAGVRQDSFEELERSLLEMEREYSAADRARAQACRRAVIEAKTHARWALRSPRLSPAQCAEKEEMILWMTTWLENPGVFPAWVELRKKVSGRAKVQPAEPG